MSTSTAAGNTETAEQISLIQKLDLGLIRKKVMSPQPEGCGWSKQKAKEVEMWYRRYLILVAKYPQKDLSPPKIVDEFWHRHILDTRKYAHDCKKIFGHMIHHFPYFGTRGKEDAERLKAAASETKALFEEEFGESPENSAALCGPASDGDAECGSDDVHAERLDDRALAL